MALKIRNTGPKMPGIFNLCTDHLILRVVLTFDRLVTLRAGDDCFSSFVQFELSEYFISIFACLTCRHQIDILLIRQLLKLCRTICAISDHCFILILTEVCSAVILIRVCILVIVEINNLGSTLHLTPKPWF